MVEPVCTSRELVELIYMTTRGGHHKCEPVHTPRPNLCSVLRASSPDRGASDTPKESGARHCSGSLRHARAAQRQAARRVPLLACAKAICPMRRLAARRSRRMLEWFLSIQIELAIFVSHRREKYEARPHTTCTSGSSRWTIGWIRELRSKMSQSSFWLPGISSLISPSSPSNAERRNSSVEECSIDIRDRVNMAWVTRSTPANLGVARPSYSTTIAHVTRCAVGS